MVERPCTLEDIREAARRIDDAIVETPLRALRGDGRHSQIFCKCENLQTGGAFKLRGATNAVRSLSDNEALRGVVTHSSGNHAQALARAARSRGIPCTVVMPHTAPAVKREATLAQGATVIHCEPTLAAREAASRAVIEETGALLIPPYDDPRIIAGQGTIGLEIDAQLAAFDTVIVPVGGGGLMAGVTLALAGLRPDVRVIAAEPAGADDAYRSKMEGRRIPQDAPDTIADGLMTSLGHHTWPVLRDLVDSVIRVDDEQIVAAMRRVQQDFGMVIEPSGAVSVAAALAGDGHLGDVVVAVISGGNVDPERFTTLLAR